MRRHGWVLAVVAVAAGSVRGSETADSHTAGEFVPAKLIEQEQSTFPVTERRAGREGSVRVSFCIAADGAVKDPIIVGSSGAEAFEREALRTIRTRKYAPATFDGRPVEQCLNGALLMFQIDPVQRAARTKFINKWKRVSAAIASARHGDALTGLSHLEPLNNYETAYLTLLWAEYARATGDRLHEIRRLAAFLWFDDYVEAQALLNARRRLFYLMVQEGQYASALWQYDALESEHADALTEDERRAGGRLRDAVRGGAILATPLRLRDTVAGETGRAFWSVDVLRSAFGFADVEGALDRFELRCQAKWYSSPVLTDRTWHVPGEWGACRLFVFGAPDAAVELREYPDGDAQPSSPVVDARAAATAD